MFSNIRFGILVAGFSVLTAGPVNLLLRNLLRPISKFLPSKFLDKFPVSGSVHVNLSEGKPLVLRSDGGDTIASRIYWRGIQGHEPETLKAFRELLPDSKVVLDVGASTGLFSLVAASEHARSEVHAFEPVPKTYRYLIRNIAANRAHNVKAVPVSVGKFDGEQTLYLNKSPALPLTTSTLEGYRKSGESIVVPAITLDTYVRENHIQNVDIIKIDAEGSDDRVLEGASSILKEYKPVIICEVLYDHTDKLIQKILDGSGYRYFFLKAYGLVECEDIVGDPEWKYRNYLFVHQDRWPVGIPKDVSLSSYSPRPAPNKTSSEAQW